ncbi:MAG: hypothetical protein WBE76_11960 [Terracidiphilus sp.]
MPFQSLQSAEIPSGIFVLHQSLARCQGYEVFERELESVRRDYGFVVAGYVLMPEHVHLLLSEPGKSSLEDRELCDPTLRKEREGWGTHLGGKWAESSESVGHPPLLTSMFREPEVL